jgi:hypothetical protein
MYSRLVRLCSAAGTSVLNVTALIDVSQLKAAFDAQKELIERIIYPGLRLDHLYAGP